MTVNSQRKFLCGLAGAALLAGMGVPAANGANPEDRLAGPDRVATSLAASAYGEADTVYLAAPNGIPDAITAGALPGRIIYGDPWGADVNGRVNFLRQMDTHRLAYLGGPSLWGGTPAGLNAAYPPDYRVEAAQIQGADRYETAAALAASQPGTTAAVLVNGENFPDALSGGALAADQNAAMILTRANELPESSYQALRRHGSEKTIVVGGPAAVSPKVAELVNGAKLNNDASKLVEGSLAESAALEAQTKAAEEKAKQDALNQVKGMMSDTDSMTNVLNQLGFTPESMKQLAAALNQPATP